MQTMKEAKIAIVGDAAYESEVVRLVNRILLTNTGQAIGLKIRSHGTLLIKASDPKDANASARSFAGLMAVIEFYPNTRLDRADVSLTMSSVSIKVRTIRLNPGFGPDEILFHEMVHAVAHFGQG